MKRQQEIKIDKTTLPTQFAEALCWKPKNTAVGEVCIYMHYEPSEDVKYMAKQPLSFIFFNRIALISFF